MTTLSRLLTRIIDRFYFPFIGRVMPLQTFRYGMCGALNMAFDALLYFIVFHFIFAERDVNLGFVVFSAEMSALAVVFPITFFNGFWLNRYVAFKRSPLRGGTQFFRYMLSVGGSIVLTIAFMKIFLDIFHIWPTPSKILTTIVTVVYSYLMQKYFTFRGADEV